jgi:hypothetical protein
MADRMRVLTPSGPQWIDVTSYADASDIGSYWNAVRKYVRTGDDSGLWPHEGHIIGDSELLTDPDEIDFWALRGELEFEDIYEGG